MRTSGCNNATGRLNSASNGTRQNCSIRASSFPYSVSVMGTTGSFIVGSVLVVSLLYLRLQASLLFFPLLEVLFFLTFFFLDGATFFFFETSVLFEMGDDTDTSNVFVSESITESFPNTEDIFDSSSLFLFSKSIFRA